MRIIAGRLVKNADPRPHPKLKELAFEEFVTQHLYLVLPADFCVSDSVDKCSLDTNSNQISSGQITA